MNGIRIMRRIATYGSSALLTLLLASSASVAAARPKASAACPRRHVHVLASNHQAEVYVRPESGENHEPYEAEEIFGCVYGHKHAYPLGSPPQGSSTGGGGIERETLAGPIVAFAQFSGRSVPGNESGKDWVVVVDLRSGKILHEVPTGTPSQPHPGDIGVGPAVAIVVKRDGAVAWIVESGFMPSEYQVHAVDKTGSRLLASDTNIAPSSLKLTGSKLQWTQGGTQASTVLN
jgi:hypothetical protein